MKISLGKVALSGFVILLCLLSVGNDFFEMTFPLSVQYAVIAVAFGLLIVLCMAYRCFAVKDIYSFLLLGMIWFVYWRNATTRYYAIYILLLSFVVVSRSLPYGWIKLSVSILKFAYIFFALATIFLRFNESIYMNSVVPLFPDYSREMEYCYGMGYMTGLTANYARNSSLISIGLIVLISEICKEKRNKPLWIALVLICSVALVLSCKRAHTLFVSFTVLFCLFLYLSDRPNDRVLKFIGIGMGIIVVGAVLINTVPQVELLVSRFSNLSEDEAVQNRFTIWGIAISVFFANPFFGVGWGNFMSYTTRLLGNSWNAHNMYLQLLCEDGIIGSLIFFSFIISVYIGTVRDFVKCRTGKQESSSTVQQYLMFSVGTQTFTLLYSLTGSPLTDIRIYVPYFLSAAIYFYYKYRGRYYEEI